MALALLATGGIVSAAVGPNINGPNYGIANAPHLGRNISLQERSARYVDVYTPVIASLYSQVQWSTHAVAFPADFVKEFDGKVVNFVGYEFDIVRPKDPSKPCVSSTSDNPLECERTSVPSYEQYNHHYTNQLYGKGKKLVRTGIPSTNPMSSHIGEVDGWAVVTDEDEAPAQPQAPSNQFLPMGNGAESRLTLKYFPRGYGALLESPTYTTINPMIIDTNARGNHSAVPGTPQIPGRHGPVPKSSNVGPEAMYSGMMECPCTDAFPKVEASAMTQATGVCPKTAAMTSAKKCFAAAASLGLQAKTNLSVSTASSPPGCFATAVSGGFEVGFNAMETSKAECGSGAGGHAQRRVAMERSLMDGACEDCNVDVDLQPAVMPASADISGSWQIAGPDATGALITMTKVGSNFTMMCNGNCGAGISGKTGPVVGKDYWYVRR